MDPRPIWILGVVFNLFMFYSMAPIYFQSPIVPIPISRTHEGNLSDVKRVVLFVADGLRADIFFDNPGNHSRLTAIMNSEYSANGISDSRAPTYSRPGFVAMLAGIYQEPSSLFLKYWSRPYEFDSVLNRTSFNVLLGCSITPLKELALENSGRNQTWYEIYKYKPKKGNIKQTHTEADIWVGERFTRLLKSKMVPSHDKLLIVLHFMGTDRTAHSTKPFSKYFPLAYITKNGATLLLEVPPLKNKLERFREHRASIELTDVLVTEAEFQVNQYYGDNQTMFIFTADHGIADYGQHGRGSPSELETPFVIWGKGIKSNGFKMRINQVDLAPFISATLNIPFPVNSIGHFPTSIWENKAFVYDALNANLRELAELMEYKKRLVYVGILPFLPFPDENEITRLVLLSSDVARIPDLNNAIDCLNKAFKLTQNGIRYYESYDLLLMNIVAAYTFLIWIALIFFTILNFEGKVDLDIFPVCRLFVDVLMSALIVRGLLGWSMWRIPCILMPLYLTHLLCSAWRTDRKASGQSSFSPKCLIGLLMISIVIIWISIYALHKREILTLGVLLNGLWNMKGKSMSTWKRVWWVGSLAALAIFPNLPVVGKMRNPAFITVGPLICGFLSLWSLTQYFGKSDSERPKKREIRLVYFQTVLVFSVYLLIHFPDFFLTRIVSWSSLLLSVTAPAFISPLFFSLRILSVFLGVSTLMCFLSFTYDSLFLPALYLSLYILTKMEIMEENDTWVNFWSLKMRRGYGSTKLSLTEAFRRAWTFWFFGYVSFLGTGSVFSVADLTYKNIALHFLSNPLEWQERALSGVRVIWPILLVASFFRLLTTSYREIQRIFLIILLLAQGMAFYNFFHILNNEIPMQLGISLAHYIIPQALTPGLALMYWAASGLMGLRTYNYL